MAQANSWDRPTGIGFGFRNFFQQLGPAAGQLWNNTRNDLQNPSIGGALRTANTIAGGPMGAAVNIGSNAFGNMMNQNAFNHLANNLNSMGTHQGQSPDQWMGQGALQNPSYPTPSTSSPLGQLLGIPDYLSGSYTPPAGTINSSGLQSSGHEVTSQVPQLGGNGSGDMVSGAGGGGYASSAPSYNGNQLSAMSSGNGNGTGGQWGTISMSQLENMLSAGGMNSRSAQMTQRREMSEMRDARRADGGARPAGMSVRDYLMQ